MKNLPTPTTIVCAIALLLAGLGGGTPAALAQENPISFTTSTLDGTSMSTGPTSLQFGPDGRLYVSIRLGKIFAYDVERQGPNDYVVTDTEEIDLVKDIPNHNDDGTLNESVNNRQVTGLLVTGTALQPVLYVTSSDPRIGAGAGGLDLNLDTNSGIISRLTLFDGEWQKVDLVRGLPRSEENHATNGMALDESTNTLYVTSGGSTNAGAPSVKFAFATEYALAAAILSVDLNAIDAMPVQDDNGSKYVYDLPTVNDPEREDDGSGNDINDPFGGNDGLNQAKIVPGGPVQIYSPGYRNPYDLVLTESGQLFTIDNGANGGWGGFPEDESANCTNDYPEGEPGSSGTTDDGRKPVNNLDNLHLVEEGFYGGHAAPVRGNPFGAGLYTHDGDNGVWRNSTSGPNPLPADWPPVPEADPRQCDFINPGSGDSALQTFAESTNGIAEYTTDNFGGALKGDLITASYDGVIWQLDLGDEPITNDGSSTVPKNQLAASLNLPLDVVAQAAEQPFSGTIWLTAYGGKVIHIMEPADYDGTDPVICTGADDENLDEDNDGFSNADEIDNGNSPCSASDLPADFDGDFVSNLNDDDDDNDGQTDETDPFSLDSTNGSNVTLPIDYPFFNEIPGTGMWGVGFTGLMSNGSSNYSDLYPDATTNVIAGGTAGLFTVVKTLDGAATGTTNTQHYGFQFGVNVDGSMQPFDTRVRVAGPFFDSTPTANQSQGMYIGTGDQDNYLKVVVHANAGAGGLQVLYESNGEVLHDMIYPRNLEGINVLDLFITVDPASGQLQPKISIENQAALLLGSPIAADGALLDAIQSNTDAIAVGIIASSGGGPAYTATWDEAEVTHDIFAVNQAPSLPSIAEQTIDAGETLSLLLSVSDPDSVDQMPSVSFLSSPTDMTLTDNGNGNWLLTWAPTNEDVGIHDVEIIASDSAGQSAQLAFSVTVLLNNSAPKIQVAGSPSGAEQVSIAINENETQQVQIVTTDPDRDLVELKVVGLPSYATFEENENGTATLALSPSFVDAGESSMTVTVTDPYGASATVEILLQVADVNHPPQVDSGPTGASQTVTVEPGFTITVPVMFSDADNDLITLALDTDDVPEGLSLTDNGDGTGTVNWDTAAVVDIKTYAVVVVATDDKGASTKRIITVEFSDRMIYLPVFQ